MELFMILLVLFGGAFYFIPTIIAIIRGKRNKLAVFVLNLLAGWTFVGWVIALVWALTTETVDTLKKD